jgi:hypothetical protein
MRIHDLRHTCASLLLAQGVHPRVVMETLGHSHISITMDTYSHVMPALGAEDERGRSLSADWCPEWSKTTTADRQQAKRVFFSERVVSREGIEPSTRRLRAASRRRKRSKS